MSHLLIVSPISDVAGGGIGIKRAFDDVGGDWEARHVRGGSEWLDYPHDAEWDELEELWDWADSVLVMELPMHVAHLPRKPTVVYHTGSRYRRDPDRRAYEAKKIGAMEVSGSLDLCRLRRTPWLPITSDLAALAKYRRDRTDSIIRVAHAPTNREIKSTEHILDILYTMDVEVDVIERVPNAECLERKSHADIYVDELTLGYGMNAIECWAMGIPVVSGIADPMFRTDALAHWGAFPFVDANHDSLRSVLEALVASPQLRYQAAERGREFINHFHSHEAVVEKVIGFMTRARAVSTHRNRSRALTRCSTLSYEIKSAEGR